MKRENNLAIIQDTIMKILIEEVPGFKEVIIDSFPDYKDIQSFNDKYNKNQKRIVMPKQDIDDLAYDIINTFPDVPINDIVSVFRDILIYLNEIENETLTCSLDNGEIIDAICNMLLVKNDITKLYFRIFMIQLEGDLDED